MRTPRLAPRHFSAIAVSVALLSACAAEHEPLAPRIGAPGAFDKASQTLYSTMEPNGSGFTVWDHEGNPFTLDMTSSEIRLHDGETMLMDPELTANMATGFHSTVEGDALAPTLENLPSADGCSGADEYCPEPSATPLTDASPLVMKYVSSDESRSRRGGKFGAYLTNPRNEGRSRNQKPKVNDGVGLLNYSYGPRCEAIKQAAEELMPRYRQTRFNLFKTIWDLKSQILPEYVNGKWVRKIPKGSSVALQLAEVAYENRSAYLQMKILAGMWVASYCGTVVWPTGGTSGSGWGSYSLVCTYEWWEISYDGGATWEPIEIRVCEYRYNYQLSLGDPRESSRRTQRGFAAEASGLKAFGSSRYEIS